MDVKAILLIGTQPADVDGTSGLSGGAPISAVDFLGRSLALRMADRLLAFGASTVYIVGDVERISNANLRPEIRLVAASGASVWRVCEDVFGDAVQNGSDLVLVERLGPYIELDYEAFVQFHLDQHNRVTPLCDSDGIPLDCFCISASRRNDAAYLFRHQLQEARTPCNGFHYRGFCNPMRSAADLRRLTMDVFNGTVALRPMGKEIRPGVWVDEGARIFRGSRVLAPAYVGRYARVRPSAVVTRFSSIEHHADIDCGSVVEDANILPYTMVGAGLDVCHAVVGNRRLMNLKRNVEVEISDPKLIGMVSQNAPLRALSSASSLLTFLPKQFLRGLYTPSQRAHPASLPQAVERPSAALKAPEAVHSAGSEAQFPASLMVARRYGNE